MSVIWKLSTILLMAMVGFAKGADPKAASVSEAAVAHIGLSGPIPEGLQPSGFMGDSDDNLRAVLGRIAAAAKDDKIKALYLEVGSAEIGLGQVTEIRAAVEKFKKSGKRVIADLQEATTRAYLLASVADEIVMPPGGQLLLVGMQMEVTFFKPLFDKLGVQADFLQMGDFKSAAEPFTRTSMSEASRKQMSALLDDMFDQTVGTISQSRRLPAPKVLELIDVGTFTAPAALKAGLIDRVEYASELRDRLAKDLKVSKVVFKRNYGRRNLEREFEGMAGMMKMLSMLAGGPSAKKLDGGKTKIVVLYATGAISTGPSQSGFTGETLGSETLIQAIKQIAKSEKTAAVVLRIDSPGGSALASDLVWQELELLKKPLVVSMGNVAASGGYYIAMGADKIFAEPGTLTGSIGVVGGKLVLGGLFSKLGLTTEVISRGKQADLFSMERPFSESGRAAMHKLLEDVYQQFTSKAATGRKMPIDKLLSLAGGRVWTGRQAKANGLVDELGTLEDAIAAARSLAKLDAKEAVDIEELPRAPGLLEALFGPTDRKGPSDAELLSRLIPQARQKLAALSVIRLLAGERILLTPPFLLEVK